MSALPSSMTTVVTTKTNLTRVDFIGHVNEWIGDGAENGSRPNDLGIKLRLHRRQPTKESGADSSIETSGDEESSDSLELVARNIVGVEISPTTDQFYGALTFVTNSITGVAVSVQEKETEFQLIQTNLQWRCRVRARIKRIHGDSTCRRITFESPYGDIYAVFYPPFYCRPPYKEDEDERNPWPEDPPPPRLMKVEEIVVGDLMKFEGYPCFEIRDEWDEWEDQ